MSWKCGWTDHTSDCCGCVYIQWLVPTNTLESSLASRLAGDLSRGHAGCHHHPWLSWCAPHRAGQWPEEIYLVLWFHPLLHNPWRWSTQSTHPASDTWRQWVQTNAFTVWIKLKLQTLLWIIMRGNAHVFSSLFYVFCLCFPLHFPSFIFFSTVWNNFIEAGRVWQVICNQVSLTYKGEIQSDSQPNLKWRRQKKEAGNAIKHKPAGQSRKVDSLTEQAAQQLHYGCRASRESGTKQIHDVCGGRHEHEAWLITQVCVGLRGCKCTFIMSGGCQMLHKLHLQHWCEPHYSTTRNQTRSWSPAFLKKNGFLCFLAS